MENPENLYITSYRSGSLACTVLPILAISEMYWKKWSKQKIFTPHRIQMSAHLQGYPVKMQAENILGGHVVLSPYLTGKHENEAFMLSQRGGDLEIILGQDMAVGHDSHSPQKVKLYFTESFTFRILEPAAVIHTMLLSN